MMEITLNQIKDVIAQVIASMENQIEESGMEGDTGYAQYLEEKLTSLKQAQSDLEGYRNQALSSMFLVRSLGQVAPTLDFDLVLSEYNLILTLRQAEIERLKVDLARDTSFLDLMKKASTYNN